MAKGNGTTSANFEQKFGSDSRFQSMSDLWMRYGLIRDRMVAKMQEWENYLKAYRRYPVKRKDGKKDANYGAFKFEIDNSMDIFQSLVLNRQTWATITPTMAPNKATKVKWSREISECWHEEFIRPWQEKTENTAFDFFDMQMFMAGIEFWKNPGDVYPENIPIEHCFPDLTSGLNPKKWETLFVLRRVSYSTLYHKMKDRGSGWNASAIKSMLETTQNRINDLSRFEKLRLDTKESNTTDNTVLLVYAYVKEYDGSISHFIFPEDGVLASKARTDISTKGSTENRFLLNRKKYCKHMGQIIAIRTYHRFKQYWAGESLADNIFIAKLQGDQSMNRILRSAVRAATTYVNSSNADTQEKLQQLSDQELVVLDSDTKIVQSNIQSNTGDLFQAVRQLDFDTSRQNQDYLPAGSQNVKGRAITAEESSNQAMQAVEKREKKTTLFIQQDQRFVDELYRRSLKASSAEDESERLDRFKAKMEAYGIPAEAYDYKNVLIESSFSLMGGSQMARMQATDRLLALTRIKPESEGVKRAVEDAIASIVGYENVELYSPSEQKPEPTDVRRAGIENEILDNANLNPMNAQVFPTDNHVADMQMHLPDIENDLKRIEQLLQQFPQLPPPNKVAYVYKLQDQMMATDNKFGHCIAHMQMMSMDPGLEQYIQMFQERIALLRTAFSSMQKVLEQGVEQLARETQENAFLTKEQEIKIQTMEAELQHAKAMNDVALGKAIEQSKLRQITGEQKIKHDDEKQIHAIQAMETRDRIETEGKIKKGSVDLATKKAASLMELASVQAGENGSED